MVVKLLPRPSWFRSGNAVRFKNSTCSVRHLQNLRSRPDVLKEEKSLSEGSYQHFLNCQAAYENVSRQAASKKNYIMYQYSNLLAYFHSDCYDVFQVAH